MRRARRARGGDGARLARRRVARARAARLAAATERSTLLNRFGAGAVVFALATFAARLARAAPRRRSTSRCSRPPRPCGVRRASRARCAASRLPRPRSWPRWQLGLAVADRRSTSLVDVLVTCAPISSADALFYHAAAPELFERAARIEEVPWAWQSVPAVHGRDARARRVPALGLRPGRVRAAPARPRRRWRRASPTAHRLVGRGLALLATALFLRSPSRSGSRRRPSSSRRRLHASRSRPRTSCSFARATSHASRWCSPVLFTGARPGSKYVAAGAAAVLAVVALAALRRQRHGAARARVRAAGARGRAAVVREERDPDRRPGLPVPPRLGERGGADAAQRLVRQLRLRPLAARPRSCCRCACSPTPSRSTAPSTSRRCCCSSRRSRCSSPRARRVARSRSPLWRRTSSPGSSASQDCALPPPRDAAVRGARGGRDRRARARGPRSAASSRSAVRSRALAVGLGSLGSSTPRSSCPSSSAARARTSSCARTVSYHEATAWLNGNLPPDARVAARLRLRPPRRPARDRPGRADALAVDAGPEETRAFFRRYGLTHALVFRATRRAGRSSRYVGARRIATCSSARPVTSRTLSERRPARDDGRLRASPSRQPARRARRRRRPTPRA